MPVANILFTSVAARGHAAPLMSLAAELARRGHNITYVAPGDPELFGPESSLWESGSHDMVNFEHPFHFRTFGDGITSKANETDMFIKWSRSSSNIDVIKDIMRLLLLVYVPLFKGLDQILSKKAYDLIISDYVTIAGFDAATKHGVPLIINWPGLKNPYYSASFASYLAFDFPVPLSNPFHRFTNHLMFHVLAYVLSLFRSFDSARREMLQPRRPLDIHALIQTTPIIYNTAVGVSELAQYNSPLEHFVGALLPASGKLNGGDSSRGPRDYEHLSPELARWIERQPDNRPVVLINFGTTGMMQDWMWGTILEALGGMPPDRRPAIIWRLSSEQEKALGIAPENYASYVKIVHWIEPSQQSLLCHPRVALFVTHGGLNSPQEAIHCGRPMLVVPSFGDQAAHGARLEASGVAMSMGAGRFTPTQVHHALEAMLGNITYYREKVMAARGILLSAGGTNKAADIVESTLRHGSEHLVPGDQRLPFLQRVLMADVVLGYCVLILVTAWVVRQVVRLCMIFGNNVLNWGKTGKSKRTHHIKGE